MSGCSGLGCASRSRSRGGPTTDSESQGRFSVFRRHANGPALRVRVNSAVGIKRVHSILEIIFINPFSRLVRVTGH